MGFALKTISIPHYTYQDYKYWEGNWELISGIPHAMSPSPVWQHQDITGNIFFQLKSKLSECPSKCKALIELDWIVSEDTVVRPDISITCEAIEGKFLTNAPELIFEVLSPSTVLKDKNTKYELYQLNKVKYYILIDPENKTFEIFELNNDVYKKINDPIKKFEFHINNCNILFDFAPIWAD